MTNIVTQVSQVALDVSYWVDPNTSPTKSAPPSMRSTFNVFLGAILVLVMSLSVSAEEIGGNISSAVVGTATVLELSDSGSSVGGFVVPGVAVTMGSNGALVGMAVGLFGLGDVVGLGLGNSLGWPGVGLGGKVGLGVGGSEG